MAIETLSINQGTQTPIAFDSIGGTAYIQEVKINVGADGSDSLWDGKVGINTQGTIASGSVVVTAGTVSSMPNTPGGTLNLVTRVGNVGTLEVGTISTLPNLPGGSIVVTAGTIGSIPNTPGGTLNLVTRVGNIGTLEVGTISTLPNIPGGTLGLVSTVTTVSNITNGSIVITAGTIGSLPNVTLAGGTVQNLNAGTITRVSTIGTLEVGTISALPNIPGGTLGLVSTVTTVSNVTNGSIVVTAGTIGSLPNVTLAGGTVQNLNAGTITRVSTIGTLEVGTISALPNTPGGTLGLITRVGNVGTLELGTVVISSIASGSINVGTMVAGTVNVGTFSARNVENVLTYGTQIAGTAASYATIVGSAAVGVGTSTYVQNFNLINPNGTVLTMLGFGTSLQGTSVLFRGVLGTQTVGGIQKSWDKAVNAGMTNQDLVVYLGGAGTVDFTVSYFIKV